MSTKSSKHVHSCSTVIPYSLQNEPFSSHETFRLFLSNPFSPDNWPTVLCPCHSFESESTDKMRWRDFLFAAVVLLSLSFNFMLILIYCRVKSNSCCQCTTIMSWHSRAIQHFCEYSAWNHHYPINICRQCKCATDFYHIQVTSTLHMSQLLVCLTQCQMYRKYPQTMHTHI